ncbi:PREDICTED: uncharacterized protein LOC106751719 [Dinoponera quadriceps]|uniref:Uncharacterized protein LOC106751719 n=1 Tax=Dinoponera quadriceps TaxID=609295 RepID=A0A6P3YEL9_DINQU|nr:PREDICTED: uncharacterized protein LOC106751719 [Dinoponera quadriceps]XP_014488253.1 PREDICTED: uncharacterized protein LOC106751719 [Dinoponera quadriceps]
MLVIVPFLAYVTWILLSSTNVGADCTIFINYPQGDLKEPQPLILRENNSYKSFLYPENNDGILRIRAGATIVLACPGKNNYLKNEVWGEKAEAVCLRNKLFHVNGGTYDFSSLICAKNAVDSTKYMKPPHYACKHTSVEIGFYMGNTFIPTIEICRDDRTYATYYTKFRMTRHIDSFQKGYPRPRFKQGKFYQGISVDNLYQFDTQNETLTKILGSSELLRGRLRKSVQYLARGHLAAKADFVYGSQQNGTFWFLNVMPQWQSFNGGNWKFLENSIRDVAKNRQLELDVYTGVYGQMTMADINSIQQPIYLYPERRILPVPKYFWKIVYDPLLKKGTAFVGLNDPFVESIADIKSLYLCTDVTKQIKWLNWSPNNITAGFSYACSVNELRRKVSEIPNFHVTGLLK